MYEIFFYKDRNGGSLIAEYLRELTARKDKNAGEPYIKHLSGEIWELRSIRDRILFAAWDGNSFILLHHFVKKTQKVPQKEIEKAKKNLTDFKERNDSDG